MADGSMPAKADDTDDEPLVTLAMQVREIDIAKRTAWFVASTDAVDTYGEIVDQGSWELDIYETNPVVLFAHKSRDLPIGQSLKTIVKDGKLQSHIQFAEERHNPEAERVWNCVVDKYLRAVSVGFIPRDYRWEKRDDKEVAVLYGNSLREISVTPVPANHEALAKMRARAMAERSAMTNAPSAQENPMDQVTKDALAAKDAEILAAKADAKSAHEKLVAAEKASADLAIEVKAAKDANDRLIKAATEQEASLKSVLGATKDETLEDAVKRNVEAKSALEASLTERDVDALIGEKLTPEQKDAFLTLAKKDRAQFDAIVKGLPDLKLNERIVAKDAGQAPATGDLADLLMASKSAPQDAVEDLASLLD